MRIARVLTRLNLGGPARQVLASDPLLAELGHVVRVFTGSPEPGEGDLFEVARQRGIDVVRVPGLRRGISPARDLVVRRRLRSALAEFQPDVLHTHASKAGSLGRQAVRGGGGFRATARVHTFHGHVLEGYFPPLVSRRLVAHERRLASETDRIVAVSHATADDLVRLGVSQEERIVVIPPGVELTALARLDRAAARSSAGWRSRLGVDTEDILVGVVGRLAEVKRVQLAVDVFEVLADRYPHLHLAFVGDGRERAALERRIRALAAERQRRVHMLGAVEDMLPVFADLDAVLLTSRAEGLPVSLIEAAASALPVVATPVGGVPELVEPERTGFLGATADELAHGLAQLLDSPQERLACGQRARIRATARHGAEGLCRRLVELYDVALVDRRGAPE